MLQLKKPLEFVSELQTEIKASWFPSYPDKVLDSGIIFHRHSINTYSVGGESFTFDSDVVVSVLKEYYRINTSEQRMMVQQIFTTAIKEGCGLDHVNQGMVRSLVQIYEIKGLLPRAVFLAWYSAFA